MLLLTVTLSIAASSANPSSAPATQPSPSPPATVAPCALDDLACYKLRWVLSDLQLGRVTGELASARRQISSLAGDLASTKDMLGTAVAALQKAKAATDDVASKVGIPWYWHPALWVTVGLVVATSLVIGFERLVGLIH